MGEPDKLEGEICPFCHTPNLTLIEEEMEIPYFGKVFMFSMNCSNCKYSRSDVECAESKPPVKYTLDVDSDKDMNIRVVRSSEGFIDIARIGSIEPGEAASGYVTNVEGILQRMKEQIEKVKNDEEEEEEIREKARALVKKINRIIWGQEKTRITIEDPTGNSAIISEKAVKTELKKGRK